MKLSLLFASIACATAAGTYFGATSLRSGGAEAAIAASAVRPATPTATEFARALAGTANEFGGARVTHPDCVQAAPGRYMCSYGLVQNGREECHIMQGRWTPNSASTITVTLAGRAGQCGSLRDALNSLD
jgi:hypothetical protein